MLPHLIRKTFPDRTWGAADLDAAAEFWLRLYEAAASAQKFSATPDHTVEVRLRGFPRHAADALRDELCRRVAVSDLPAPEVYSHDPDTLVLFSGVIDGSESPPRGLGLPLLAGDPFDGLLAEVRVGAAGTHGRVFGSSVQTTLVLVGELRGGELLLKAVWRSGTSGWEDQLCWHGAWVDEASWLAALDEFRETEKVPARLAKKLFLTPGADRTGGRFVRLIHAPLGQPRLVGLLVRCAVFAVLIAGLVAAVWWGVETEHWLALAAVAVWGWIVLMLAWFFVRTEAKLLFAGYRQFHTGYSRLYAEAVRVVPLARAAADARLANPTARKYAADLEAAGFTSLGDTQSEPPVSGDHAFRVFLAPDGVTYLTVIFTLSTHADPDQGFRMWPAGVAFLAHTYFPDGGRVSSMHGRHIGYRKKRSGPEHLVRLFTDVDDPVELVRRHREVVLDFAKETGRAPLPHERFDQYVRRQNENQEEERRLYADAPYTWGDHLHWYLQTPRREYRP
jgi:hypothetical protein